YNETSAAGSDFSNNFPGNQLPFGTTEVIGVIQQPGTDNNDFFQFMGLVPNQAFTLSVSSVGLAGYELLNSSNSQLTVLTNNPPTLSGTVPTDGILIVHVAESEATLTNYDLTLNAQYTPEPSSAAAIATAAAGAWALRRKLKK